MVEFVVADSRGIGLSSDPAAFEGFYRDHHVEVARALIIAIGDRELGSEAADEAFARAFERWDQVNGYENRSGWVYRVGLNWARGRIRRRSYRPSQLLDGGVHVDELPEPELIEAVAMKQYETRQVQLSREVEDLKRNQNDSNEKVIKTEMEVQSIEEKFKSQL